MSDFEFLYTHTPEHAPASTPASAPAPVGAAPEARTQAAVSRRDFFKIGAAATGGLLVSLYLPRSAAAAAGPFEPNVFIRIDPDDLVTLTIPKSEMGQGIRTALSLILAEELDADWSKVRVETASYDEKYGGQGTGGSSSIRTRWTSLREAGATARAMLMAAAAQTWGVEPSTVTAENGMVVHRGSNRRLSYGKVAARAAGLPVPANVPLKDPKQFRLIGKPTIGVDVPDIVQGKAVYGVDVRVPGMLYAVIERCPIFGGKVARFDASKAKAVPGVRAVVEVPATGRPVHVASGVAVVAENTWAAMKGREALEVEWEGGANASDSSEGFRQEMERLTQQSSRAVHNQGDADAVLAQANDVLLAVYELPFLSHSPMEPMNCTAHYRGQEIEVWAPTQNPGANASDIAAAIGLPKEAVKLHVTLMGGGFGRRLKSDFAVEAAVVSKAVGAPVQVMWTREDDTQHGFYRPINLHRVEAVLDDRGYPAALRHRIASTSLRESSDGPDAENLHGAEVGGASDMVYRIPNRRTEYANVSAAVPRGPWRSVAHTHTAFAVESFIDEMAAKAGKDPLQYRLDLLDLSIQPDPKDPYSYNPARLKAVLELAARKAGWGEPLPKGRGRGIASHYSFRAYGAQVFEVTVDDGGNLKVDRVVAAIDCGTVINPDTAVSQVQGAVIDGLSAALKGEITMRDGRVEQGNFDGYELLRINEAPPVIDVYFVESAEPPSGLGEPALPPVAPALANAIYAATGVRVRKLPLKYATLRG